MNDTDESHAVDEASNPADEDPRRKQAVARIERRRHFHGELVVIGIGVVILIAIWATTEYHNAGGWPTRGRSNVSRVGDELIQPATCGADPKQFVDDGGAYD